MKTLWDVMCGGNVESIKYICAVMSQCQCYGGVMQPNT